MDLGSDRPCGRFRATVGAGRLSKLHWLHGCSWVERENAVGRLVENAPNRRLRR